MLLPCAVGYYHLPMRQQFLIQDDPMVPFLDKYILLLELSLAYKLCSAMRAYSSLTDDIEAFLQRKVLGSLARMVAGVCFYILGAFSFHYTAIFMYMTKKSSTLGLNYRFGAVECWFRLGLPAVLMYAACRIFLIGFLRLLRILPGRKREAHENVTWTYLLFRPAVLTVVLVVVLEVYILALVLLTADMVANGENEEFATLAQEFFPDF